MFYFVDILVWLSKTVEQNKWHSDTSLLRKLA